MKLILATILIVLIQSIKSDDFIHNTISKLQHYQEAVHLLKNKDNNKATVQNNINHYIKWITNQTVYPIKISEYDIKDIESQEADLNDTMTWDWKNLKDDQLMTNSSKLFKKYLVTERFGVSDFYILSYNNKTHEELATYEPVMINHVSKDKVEIVKPSGSDQKRNMFTLAFLNSHTIKAKRQEDSLRVKCVADFYVSRLHPKFENESYISFIMSEMEKHANFKIAISSTKQTQQQSLPFKEQYQQQNLVLNTQAPPTSLPPSPQPSPNNRGQARNFFKPILNTNQASQLTTPTYNFPNPKQMPIVNDNPNQYRMYQQNLHSNPTVNYATPSHDDLKYYYHTADPSPYDFIQLTPIDYPMPMNYVKYNGFQSFMPLISRIRRQTENTNIVGDEEEEEDNYDMSKFFKVRLSIGPIAIKNNQPENEEEEISCTLNLMNSHDADLSDFSSTIHKKINLNIMPSIATSSISSSQPFQPSEAIEKQANLNIDSNNKKEIMFFIDSNNTTTAKTSLSKSEVALENIRNKGLTQMDRLLASSGTKIQIFEKCYWLVLVMWIVNFVL